MKGSPQLSQQFDILLEERIGFGAYQYLAIVVLSLVRLNDGCQLDGIQIVMPVVKQSYSLQASDLQVISSLYFLGQMVGCILGGWITDKYGRKSSLIFSSIFNLLTSFSLLFVNNVFTLGTTRLLLGLVYGFSVSIPNSYAAEIFNIKYRGKILLILNIMLTFGKVLAAVFASLYLGKDLALHNWQPVIYSSSIGAFLAVIISTCFMTESPRFLLAQGRIDEAAQSIDYMIKFNDSKQTKVSQQELDNLHKDYHNIYKNQPKQSISSLFTKKLIRVTVLLCLAFLCTNSVYYGILQILPFMVSKDSNSQSQFSPAQFMIINAMSEIPTIVVTMALVDSSTFGRKKGCLVFTFTLAMLMGYSGIQFSDLVMFLARFTMKCLLGMMIPLSVESFGTLNRTIGVSFCMSFGKIGPFLIPFVLFKLLEASNAYPFILFSILCFTMTFFIALLPKDSTNQALDEQLVDKSKSLQTSLLQTSRQQAQMTNIRSKY